MVASTSIEVTHKFVRGWHIFEAEQMPGLYVANQDARRAYSAIGPAIEKLIELDTGVSCRAVADVPFSQFITTRSELAVGAAHQKFNLFKEAA